MSTVALRTPTRRGFRRAAEQIVPPFLLGFMPLATAIVVVAAGAHLPQFLWDFKVFFHAGNAVLAGHSPYPPPDPSLLAHENNFVYPPEMALLFAPLALLPYPLAASLFLVVLFVSVPLTVWVLGIRDWRCYGAAFLMAPILSSLANGAISILLALGLALAWRFRRSWKGAAAVAGVIAAKVFLWPLLFWLVATRRYAAAAGAAIGGAVVTLAAWAVLGFAGLRDYVHLLRVLSDVEQAKGFSPIALGLALGLPTEWARVGAWLLGAAALAAVFVLARREDGERRSLAAAVGAALVLSPIVWMHYFSLLLVPIALGRPRFTPLWLLPALLWFAHGQSQGNVAQIMIALAGAAVVVVIGARSRVGGAVRGVPELAPQPAADGSRA